MSRDILVKFVTYLSIAYVTLISLSFLFSQRLPSLEEIGYQRNTNCYWTDALVVFVKCGEDLSAHALRSFFYNFWTHFIYYPMFAISGSADLIGMTILIYAPLVFLVYVLVQRFRRP